MYNINSKPHSSLLGSVVNCKRQPRLQNRYEKPGFQQEKPEWEEILTVKGNVGKIDVYSYFFFSQ